MSNENLFLKEHSDKISKILFDLERYEMMGSYGGSLNLKEIRSIIKSLMIEIRRQNDLIVSLRSTTN